MAGTVPGAGNTAARKPDVAKHTQNRQAGILTEEQTRNKKVIRAHLGDIVFGSRPLQESKYHNTGSQGNFLVLSACESYVYTML